MSSKKPFVLGLDLDGVVGDYVSALRNVVSLEKGLDPKDMSEPVEFNMSKAAGWSIKDTAEYFSLHQMGVRKYRIYRDLPVLEDAVEALKLISEAGVRIKVVTHRLLTKGDHNIVIGDTSEWLEKNNIPFSDICFVEDKAAVNADVYIEDAPHNITALQNELGVSRVLIYDQLYNRGVEGVRVTENKVAGRKFSRWARLGAFIPELAQSRDN